jgi:hypothetical protein
MIWQACNVTLIEDRVSPACDVLGESSIERHGCIDREQIGVSRHDLLLGLAEQVQASLQVDAMAR